MLSYSLLALLLAAQPISDLDTSKCALDRMSERDKDKAGTDLFDGKDVATKGPLAKALLACAKERRWNEKTTAVIARGAAIKLITFKVIDRFAARKMPLDAVQQWFDRQPEAVQVTNKITPEMIGGAAAVLLKAGVPRETLMAEAKAISIALYSMVELRRMQKGMPQLGT